MLPLLVISRACCASQSISMLCFLCQEFVHGLMQQQAVPTCECFAISRFVAFFCADFGRFSSAVRCTKQNVLSTAVTTVFNFWNTKRKTGDQHKNLYSRLCSAYSLRDICTYNWEYRISGRCYLPN